MEMISLKCENPECPEPHWERERQKGRTPLFCPPCDQKKKEAKIVKDPIQTLVCAGEECSFPGGVWTRERRLGAAPNYCPQCQEKRDAAPKRPEKQTLVCKKCEKEWTRDWQRGSPRTCPECKTQEEPEEEETDETVVRNDDPAIFSSTSSDELEKAMSLLNAKYGKTEFYLEPGREENEQVIMLRPKYGIKVSSQVLDVARTLAAQAQAVPEAAAEPEELPESALEPQQFVF